MPARLSRLPLAAFLQRLPSVDDDWQRRVAREAARGRVLRYLVMRDAARASRLAGGGAGDQPGGRARGTRNLISFTPARYATSRSWSPGRARAPASPPPAS